MSLEFLIEDGIPMPPSYGNSKNRSGVIAAVRSMKAGQSFAFDGKRQTLSSYAHYAAKKYGGKFTVRSVDGGGARVWCIEPSGSQL